MTHLLFKITPVLVEYLDFCFVIVKIVTVAYAIGKIDKALDVITNRIGRIVKK